MINKRKIGLNEVIYLFLIVAVVEGCSIGVLQFFSKEKPKTDINRFVLQTEPKIIKEKNVTRVLRKIVYTKKASPAKITKNKPFSISLLPDSFKVYAPKVTYAPHKFSSIQKKQHDTFEKSIYWVAPNSDKDILNLKADAVPPIIYTKSVQLHTLSVADKKRTFINMMIPSILVAKYRMEGERRKVLYLMQKQSLTKDEEYWLKEKREEFHALDSNELYDKMTMHPTSIIIAQAIIESGWGTSRFFQKANNVFGIWSFNKDESRIRASEKRGKTSIYVKKYSSVEKSIYDYFLVLSTKNAYKSFREKRLETQDPYILINHLGNYSELRGKYIKNLRNTIRINDLQKYDGYTLAFK